MASQAGQEVSVQAATLKSLPGAQVGKRAVMVAAVESTISRYAPAQNTFSALIKTASGRSTPENAEEQVSRIVGMSRDHMVTRRVDKELANVQPKIAARAEPRVVAKPKLRVIVRLDYNQVKDSNPHFFSY